MGLITGGPEYAWPVLCGAGWGLTGAIRDKSPIKNPNGDSYGLNCERCRNRHSERVKNCVYFVLDALQSELSFRTKHSITAVCKVGHHARIANSLDVVLHKSVISAPCSVHLPRTDVLGGTG
jgi:hypothetical protein